jgi:hypothetical protein
VAKNKPRHDNPFEYEPRKTKHSEGSKLTKSAPQVNRSVGLKPKSTHADSNNEVATNPHEKKAGPGRIHGIQKRPKSTLEVVMDRGRSSSDHPVVEESEGEDEIDPPADVEDLNDSDYEEEPKKVPSKGQTSKSKVCLSVSDLS